MRRLADLVVRWPFVVIGVWIAIAVVLPLTFPSLTEMSRSTRWRSCRTTLLRVSPPAR